MSENILEISGLSKHYRDFHLDDINFCLPKGYIMGLIGPNGSGKTTTIKLIMNMLKKTAGNVTVFDKDNVKEEQSIKKELGVVFDSNYFVDEWNMSTVEKSISPFYENWNSARYHELLAKFRIDKNKKVSELSKGMQMKLMLACAFSYDAKLLILDEPTSGLDPVSRDELLEILSEYIEDGQHSVLFSTHITSDLDKVADYITYLHFGKQQFTGGKDEFVDSFRVVKGGKEELTLELKKRLVGMRNFSTGFEGLIKTSDLASFTTLEKEPATIDDIIIFMNRGGIEHA